MTIATWTPRPKNHRSRAELAGDATLLPQALVALVRVALEEARATAPEEGADVPIRVRAGARRQFAGRVLADPSRFGGRALWAAAAVDALPHWFELGPTAVTDEQVEAAVRAAWDALAVSS